MLWTADELPFAVGVSSYYDSAEDEAEPSEPRIYIRIRLHDVGGVEVLAMVDTGAPWCILQGPIAKTIKPRLLDLEQELVMSTRFGRIVGRLYSGVVSLIPDDGEALAVETTFFLSPDWPGGNFVGYLGFLDRIRFAIDPINNFFYFGPP